MINFRGIITVVGFLVVGLMACDQQGTTKPTDQQLANLEPEFVRTNSSVVKKSGWEIPAFPKDKQSRSVTAERDGQTLKLIHANMRPSEDTLVTIPKHWEDGETTYKVNLVVEMKGERQAPFCYQFYVTTPRKGPMNHTGVSTFFSYLDDNGDGIFETLGSDCRIPNWVK